MDRPVHSYALPCSRHQSDFIMQRITMDSANDLVSMQVNTILIFECKRLQELQGQCIGKSDIQSSSNPALHR